MSDLSEHLGWVEVVFSGTVAFGFGFYQLWSVNREIAADKEKQAQAKQRPEADDSSS